ncbi:AI-2E family transporter [Kitasatospora sp. NA04385]|uniref:AI-2E family transporter n=1 Tax=Kitasatospora sp. NA04385 TaxID=2742135 RepID=UPI0015921356|nr:AI-2E family transporter [Kitasatospora sp. NA04385]QKW21845.1 AI-2E family transporter [Kitasatospora sp. NA04385]
MASSAETPDPTPDTAPGTTARAADAVAAADAGGPDAGGPDAGGAETAAARLLRRAELGGGAMPRWLPRAILLALVGLGLFQLADWAFHQLIDLFVMLLVAFFLSLAMEPAVDRMAARGVRRGLGTFLVFIGLALAVAGFLASLGTLLVDQITQIAGKLPQLLQDLINWINHTFHTELSLDQLQHQVLQDSGTIEKYAQQAADNVWGVTGTVIGGLFQAFTVGLFTFYFTAEGPRVRRTVCSLLPPSKQGEVLRAWEIALAKTGGYLYSRALLALISTLGHWAFFAFIDLPYAAALAVWVGVMSQFVPTIGTYLAGALPVLVGLTVRPVDALWVLVFVTVYQQIENYLLHPRITAKTVDVHPAVAFGAVIAGAALLGAVGALIAIPVAATLQGFVGTYVRRYEVEDDPRIDRGEERRERRRHTVRRLRRMVSGGTGDGGRGGNGGGNGGGRRSGGSDGGGADGGGAGRGRREDPPGE